MPDPPGGTVPPDPRGLSQTSEYARSWHLRHTPQRTNNWFAAWLAMLSTGSG
jgi:hypothetical protein